MYHSKENWECTYNQNIAAKSQNVQFDPNQQILTHRPLCCKWERLTYYISLWIHGLIKDIFFISIFRLSWFLCYLSMYKEFDKIFVLWNQIWKCSIFKYLAENPPVYLIFFFFLLVDGFIPTSVVSKLKNCSWKRDKNGVFLQDLVAQKELTLYLLGENQEKHFII